MKRSEKFIHLLIAAYWGAFIIFFIVMQGKEEKLRQIEEEYFFSVDWSSEIQDSVPDWSNEGASEMKKRQIERIYQLTIKEQ